MKNIVKKLALVLAMIHIALTVNIAFAEDEIKKAPTKPGDVSTPVEYLKEIGKKTGLPDYDAAGKHPDSMSAIEPGAATVVSPIYFVIDILRYIVSTIAFIVVVISAVKLISTSTEEEAGKAKNSLLVGLLGLIVINLADVIVKKMFFGEQGEAFEDLGTAKLYAEESLSQIRGIVGFLEIFIGAIAVLVIVIRGFTLVTSGGDEEKLTAAKKHVIYAVAGLAVVGLAEVVVRGVIFPDAGAKLPNVGLAKVLIVKITNFLAGFIALISFVSLFASGYRYVTSGGEEEVKEKVKKTFFAAVIALVLSLGAFAAVNTLVTLDSTVGPNATQPKTP